MLESEPIEEKRGFKARARQPVMDTRKAGTDIGKRIAYGRTVQEKSS